MEIAPTFAGGRWRRPSGKFSSKQEVFWHLRENLGINVQNVEDVKLNKSAKWHERKFGLIPEEPDYKIYQYTFFYDYDPAKYPSWIRHLSVHVFLPIPKDDDPEDYWDDAEKYACLLYTSPSPRD